MGRSAAIAAALLALGAACVAREPDASGTLEVFVAVRTGAGAEAAFVHLSGTTAAGQAHDGWYRVPRSPDGFAGPLAIAAGRYAVDARGFAAAPADPASATAELSLAGLGALDLAPGDQHVLALVLDPPVAESAVIVASPTKNVAPRVSWVSAGPIPVDSSDPAAALSLAGSASDKNGDTLTYLWTAAYAPALAAGSSPGAFSSPAATSTRWTPPPMYDGYVTFTFTARDPLGATGALAITVRVRPLTAPGNVAFTARVNNFPDVTQLTVSDGQLAAGAQARLAVTAVDPDADPLAYAWSSSCGGTFLAGAAASATWTAPAGPASCRIAVTVTDRVKGSTVPRGGATSSSVSVTVGEPPARFAPAFAACVSSPPGPVAPGSVVSFYVSADEPIGSPAVATPITSFTWADGTARGASAFAPLAPGRADAVAWTAPPCAGATAPLSLVVTATAVGSNLDPATQQPLTTPFPFPAVQVTCP